MQDHRSHGRDCERPHSDVRKEATTKAQDEAIECAVLLVVLDRHPAQLTLAELAREVADDPDEFKQVDAVERAVGDLSRAGILHRNGEFVLPSQTTLRFAHLVDHWSGS